MLTEKDTATAGMSLCYTLLLDIKHSGSKRMQSEYVKGSQNAKKEHDTAAED